MKFLRPSPGQSLDVFRMLAQQEDYEFSDPDSGAKFVNKLSEEFTRAKNNPIMLHGFRVQAMFEYVAASLGRCNLIKTEDAGGLHTKDPNVKVPDLRVLLIDGKEFFVEVKNFYQSNPFESFKIKKDYLDELRRYGGLFKKDVKLAVYWSKWNLWSLVPLDSLNGKGSKCSLLMEDALKHNEMIALGDCMIATLPPLKFRVITDPTYPRNVNERGEASFRIGGVELRSRETLITNTQEQNIALFLMLYGNWPSEGGEAQIENGELVSFDIVSQPFEPIPEHDFQILGSLSEMVSRRFNMLTTRDGSVEKLAPISDISALGIEIPEDYKGDALPLWRFKIEPSSE